MRACVRAWGDEEESFVCVRGVLAHFGGAVVVVVVVAAAVGVYRSRRNSHYVVKTCLSANGV